MSIIEIPLKPKYVYWRIETVLSVVPFSRSTLYRLILQDKFPKPTKVSENISMWKDLDIYNWMESQEEGDI